MSRIAIVGGGISGIGAAHKLLQEGFNVLLFEVNPQLGGIGGGMEITNSEGRKQTIDCSVNDYNPNEFPEFSSFVDELGLDSCNIRQNITFMRHTGEPLWSLHEGHSEFHGKVDDEEELRKEISRISRDAQSILRDDSLSGKSAKEYLTEEDYNQEFQDLFFLPLSIGCLAMPNTSPEDYPIQSLIRYWTLTGIIGDPLLPQRTIVGGMHLYSQTFQQRFLDGGGYLFTNTKVVGIARQRSFVIIKALSQNGQHLSFKVDHVIMASRATDVVHLIEDIGPRERAIFSQFMQQRVRMCIHTDTSLMPQEREHWGNSNYVVPSPGVLLPKPTQTIYPRKLLDQVGLAENLLISINPGQEPKPETVLSNHYFNYPVPNDHGESLAFKVQDIQGTKRTWYCGSYLHDPFLHEQGFLSGIKAATEILAHEERQAKILGSMYQQGNGTNAEEIKADGKHGAPAPVDIIYVGKDLFVSREPVPNKDDQFGIVTGIFCGQVSLKLSKDVDWENLPTEGNSIYISFPDQPTQMFYFCRTTVLRSARSKGGELIIEYPKTVEKYRRRRFLRSQVTVNGKLTSRNSGTNFHEIKTINISAGGAYFELLSPFAYDGPTKMGDPVELELCLPEQEPMRLPAHVVRVESQTSLEQVITQRLAVEFDEVASKERTKIGLFVYESNRRKYHRVLTSIPAKFHIGNSHWQCTAENLSGGGVLISIEGNPPDVTPGKLGKISLPIPEQGNIEAGVDIVRVQELKDPEQNTRLQVGLEFVDITKENRNKVIGLIQFLLRSGFSDS